MSVLAELDQKAELFESRGYLYSLGRDCYVNRNRRKAFSLECVEDHDVALLTSWLEEPSSEDGNWQFYFSGAAPSAAVREDLTIAFGR